jgi:hypothetical protein
MTTNLEPDQLKKEIIFYLEKEELPKSTQDIAETLSRPWHSIQTRCLTLQIAGKLTGFRVGRVNLWQIKK